MRFDTLTRHKCALAALPSQPGARIELLPLGEFRLADARGALAMRVTDAVALIAASLTHAPGNVLPIDFDHRSFADQGSADSRAAGWITAMAVEGSRIMATVEWTAEGRRALEDRSYRFVSPVFKTSKGGDVMLIEGAGLVNTPAIPQLRQLASKDTMMIPAEKLIEQIAELLGIAADKPADILARLKAFIDADVPQDDTIKASKSTDVMFDPTRFVPKTSFDALQSQFASLKKSVDGGRVEQALEQARDQGKLTPDLEDWATQLASRDFAMFQHWLDVAPVRVNLTGQRQLAGKTPPPELYQRDRVAGNTDRTAVCAQLGLNPSEIG